MVPQPDSVVASDAHANRIASWRRRKLIGDESSPFKINRQALAPFVPDD
jgi:hypothetical protein